MDDRRNLTPEHDQHDRVLIARFAVGDAYPTEKDQAKRLVDGCDECAGLASDIKLISARTSELPPIERPRDFRITPVQADNLRGSWFDRFMRGLAGPGWTVVRPLAGAALAIGLALVVVGALPLGTVGGSSVPEAAPGVTDQVGVAPSTPSDFAAVPEAPTTGDAQIANGFSMSPAATQASLKAGDAPTAVPGTTVGSGGQTPGSASTTPDAQAMTSPPTEADRPTSAAQSPASPPLPLASPAPEPPRPIASVGGQALAVPTSPPTSAPQVVAPVAGPPSTDAVSTSSPDKSGLVVLGMVIALLALLVLGLALVARRRYAERLVG